MMIQILEMSALDLLVFVLLSNVVQSILFMNEFFAAFMAFYNWMMVDVSFMTN